MRASEQQVWVGIDWGDQGHVVRAVSEDGKKAFSLTVTHSANGIEQLLGELNTRGPIAGIAVETSRHVLVYALLQAGHTIYAINPKQSHAWRESESVSGAKDDERDALTLAMGLCEKHRRLKPLRLDDPDTRTLALLCEGECTLIKQQTRLVQQLQATLKQYFPAALEVFGDWTTQTAWDFILTFPMAEAFAKASKRKVCAFLKSHHIGLSPKWLERVEKRTRATDWPSDEPTVAAKALLAQSLARQLRALKPSLDQHRKRITALFEAHPDRAIFESLPGSGPKLAPRLLTSFGTQRDRFESAASVQQLSGAAPVTEQSGSSKHVHIRRACQKRFRNTLHQFAFQSIRQSAWSRAYYDLARGRGLTHAKALRSLANKWIKIIYRMWQTNEVYDENKYQLQLVKTRSPIAYKLGLLKSR